MKQQDVPVFKRMASALHRQSERHKRAMRHLEETADAAMVGWAKAAAEVEKLTAERDEARAALARVDGLHERFEHDGVAYCGECRDSLAGAARWPCPTIAARNGSGT